MISETEATQTNPIRSSAATVAPARPVSSAPVETATSRSLASAGWLDVMAPSIGLYLLAAALLLIRIDRHPANAYNWENYAAWGVFHFWDGLWAWSDLWRLNDGLMTDSGESPLVVIPVWVGWKIFGVGVLGLRVPLVLVGALAVPLTWLVGRRLAGANAALLAAMLMAISPVFLLYARTATLVGISLVPALITIYALLRVLRPDAHGQRAWIGWLATLQILLIADSYAYSVLRFLWLIALVLFILELGFRPALWRYFGPALTVTAVILPTALVLLGRQDDHSWHPKDAVVRYYNGRGEQILQLNDQPAGYRFYLRQSEEERAAGGPEGSAGELAWRLIRQNATDYGNLLLDRQTRPAITDYWNPNGRLYPRLLVPFFLLGLAVAAVRFWRPRIGVEARALLALFFGFGIPLFLTSRVHIGRLIIAVPFLFLLIGLGVMALAATVRWQSTSRVSEPSLWTAKPFVGLAPITILAVILLALTAQDAWADYHVAPGPSREWSVAQTLQANVGAARAAGGAALVAADGVGAEIEAIDAGSYRLLSDKEYRYVNLADDFDAAVFESIDSGPPLYIGRILDRLRAPATMPGLCTNLYFVRPDAEQTFLEVTNGGRPSGCPAPLKYLVLPG